MTETGTFGALLRQHRLAASLSQEVLAERARLSVNAIAALERGRRTAPRPGTVILLSEALGLGSVERATFVDAASGAGVVDVKEPQTPQRVWQLTQPEQVFGFPPLAELERGARQTPQVDTVPRLAEALGLAETDRATLESASRDLAVNAAVATHAPSGLPTGTVTFLFTDMEGSTRLWQRYRDRMGPALARHDELIQQLVAQHDGTLVRPRGEGDSRFAVFASASDGVAAAGAIQIALVQEAWNLPEPLHVRIAVHAGEADSRLGDYYGPAVNHAARLRSAAHGGQVLISSVVADLVGESLMAEVTLRDLGEYRLKDLERPERIWQLVHPDLPADFPPPLLSRAVHPNNLRVQATPLIGREQELTDVQRRLLDPGVRLLTLAGAGGVGKTRLALQVAADVLERFVDGVFVVPLAAIRDATLVVPTIAQILSVREQSGTSLLQTLQNFLREKSLLLVLDNFEQVLPAAVSVAELVGACPRLRVLVTSRALLRVYGEQEISVPTLRLPSAPWPAAEQLSQYDGVRLLVERAQAVRPDFQVTDDTAPAIAAICARLDGLPLAIELAAARLNLLTPDALLARLNQRFDLLVGGPRDRPQRHQTLSATIQWSFDLLDAQQKALFRRLGVFVGGCTLDAAEWVCGSEGQLPSEVLNGMGALVDQSLIHQQVHVGSEPRLDMLESIREFALEQLVASGEADEIRRRHVDCFINLGERAALEFLAGPEHVRWMDRLDREKHNLRAALLWCVENGKVERGLQLGGAVSGYWYLHGSFNEARDWRQGLLRLLPGAGRTILVARALTAAGVLSIHQGDFSTAKVLHEQSLAIGREWDDHGRIASSLNNLGMVALREGDSGLAQRLFEEALAESRAAGDRRTEAHGLNLLGGALADRREYESAFARHGESAAMYLALGNRSKAASALSRQGSAARAAGDFVSAEALCQESLRLARESGDRSEVAWSYLHLAFVRLHQVDYADAQELFVRCLQQWDGSVSAGHGCGFAAQGLACIAASLGQADRAMRLFGAAEGIDRVRWRPAGLTNAFGFTTHFSTMHWQALAASALGEQEAAKALAVGSVMSVDEAITYALEIGASALR